MILLQIKATIPYTIKQLFKTFINYVNSIYIHIVNGRYNLKHNHHIYKYMNY